MRIRQTEGWHLWEKSIVIRRQALRRGIASILVVLLTGAGLLGTPAFGDNWKEMMDSRCRGVEGMLGYWCREAVEAQASMNRCGSEFFPFADRDQYLAQVDKCLKDRQPRLAEAWRCMNPLAEHCGYARLGPAPQRVGCPDGQVPGPQGDCVAGPAASPAGCPEGEVPKGPQGTCIPEAVALAACLDPDGDTLFNLGKCTKICKATELSDLITDGGATVAGATAGAGAGSVLCPPFVLTGPWTVIACYAFTTMIGGELLYLGSQAVDTCSKKCWIDFQMDLERCRRSVIRSRSQ